MSYFARLTMEYVQSTDKCLCAPGIHDARHIANQIRIGSPI